MNLVLGLCLALSAISAILTLYRIAEGPDLLDRAVGFDVLVACFTGMVFVWGAMTGRKDVLIVIVVLALTSFISSTVISRFARTRIDETERRLTDEEQRKLDLLREQEESRYINQETRLFERLWLRQNLPSHKGGEDK
ncbi:MAG: monovalent cation/H+ antiporter complex subunit F [Actinomycetaceae bacterium]|nr:monovalent cation/H+ antiporter complex subunit F [Actinomycetaceae bacterium]